MPTSKLRISLPLPTDLKKAIQKIADKSEQTMAFTIIKMLQEQLDIEEDRYWNRRATAVEARTKAWMSHDAFWNSIA